MLQEWHCLSASVSVCHSNYRSQQDLGADNMLGTGNPKRLKNPPGAGIEECLAMPSFSRADFYQRIIFLSFLQIIVEIVNRYIIKSQLKLI